MCPYRETSGNYSKLLEGGQSGRRESPPSTFLRARGWGIVNGKRGYIALLLRHFRGRLRLSTQARPRAYKHVRMHAR